MRQKGVQPEGHRSRLRGTLATGTGEVFAVGPVAWVRRIGSWTVTDGYRPFRSGTYELHRGRGSVHVTSPDPVTRSAIPEIT
ncbi:hypothetical protein [Streptomyces sp. KMM 9044]|uniref:hypothetical protein n=1 Tax=Streptomyces sp. KMM 9044 TaxID=2744474 RepID=UPI002150C5E4|nr:hypothetical protein [Streptomyces sp. KMM 9044]WAX79494.1 hypothetical protein HUV60_019300 [Streptomyces sp. KMM 9044]